jgi:hypothetical protein
MLSRILGDAEGVPKTIGYKFRKGLITLADEEEACTNPRWAYRFALEVHGANIEKCEDSACKDPCFAYLFARWIPEADIEKCQEVACQKTACNDFYGAYMFAKYIPGADVERCRKACEGTEYAY